jgi:hypothetical protein
VPLEKRGVYPELQRLLKHCCADEVHHKEDARSRSVRRATVQHAYVWPCLTHASGAPLLDAYEGYYVDGAFPDGLQILLHQDLGMLRLGRLWSDLALRRL